MTLGGKSFTQLAFTQLASRPLCISRSLSLSLSLSVSSVCTTLATFEMLGIMRNGEDADFVEAREEEFAEGGILNP